MRISDWSSDVCSSDLYCQVAACGNLQHDAPYGDAQNVFGLVLNRQPFKGFGRRADELDDELELHFAAHRGLAKDGAYVEQPQAPDFQQVLQQRRALARSEEHTSELQSLMRISY